MDPAQDHFVLAVIDVFERGIFNLIRAADNLVAGWGVAAEPNRTEIHGSLMYQGSGVRRRRLRANRERIMNEALALLRERASIRAFGVAVCF